MNPEEVYTLGMLLVILGLTLVYLFPGSILITLGIMFIGVLALIAVIRGVALILCGGSIGSLMMGTMFLVILVLLFDGVSLITYAIKVILASAVTVLHIIAAAIASII